MTAPTEEEDQMAAVREKVFRAAYESIDHSTVPICFYNNGVMTPDRTGVLLKIGSLHFLITAAHVGDNHRIPDATAQGYCPCIALPEKGTNPVPIISDLYVASVDLNDDIAVFLLSDETVALIAPHYRFLRLSQLQSRHHKANEHAMYLISGFPEGMIVQEPDAKRMEIWRYLTVLYDGNYDNVPDFIPSSHIVLKYERQTHNRDGKTIHPPGMSGCGIWFVAHSLTWPLFTAADFRLTGIQNAWHKDHEYAKGTWIDVVLKIIWRYFPAARGPMQLNGMVFDEHPVLLSRPS